jgi:hypothetical protein
MLSKIKLNSDKTIKYLTAAVSTLLVIALAENISAVIAATPSEAMNVSQNQSGTGQSKSNQDLEVAGIKKAVKNNLEQVAAHRVVAVIERIFVVDRYAVADWVLGDGGGQAVLTKKQNTWQVLATGGGAVSDKYLRSLGVPQSSAQKLMALINKADN